MTYIITAIANHEREIERIRKDSERFARQDVSEAGLSSWGNDSMVSAHRLSIGLLKNGLNETGKEIPYGLFSVLRHNDIEVNAKMIQGKYGMVWLLDDDEAENYGRKFVPVRSLHRNVSRVQTELGLSEGKVFKECKRYLGANCGGVGMPVTYYPIQQDKDYNPETN
ncbi:MAG: hypothetical protein GQ468_02875 [Candidatus Scalindua sp.]|nr:hypothetical protein [Candidatus Scalindua sp.]